VKFLHRLGKLLLMLGCAGFIGATAWWYMFFEGLLGQNVKQASACFYETTSKCEVGNMIGAFGDVPTYSPLALWLSVALMVAGGVMYGLIGKK
jgi:hypothetical protein